MTTSSSNSLDTSKFAPHAPASPGLTELPESTVVFDKDRVEKAIDQLAVRLNVDLHHQNPVFISVLHGGLPFTSDLVMRFQGCCELAYVHVGRYGHGTDGGELVWHVEPTADLRDRVVVYIDDVLDRGETLQALRKRAEELGARKVLAAVLVRKAVAQCSSHAEYIALESPNLFLFGRGMDIEGQWRNLPEIRAVAASGDSGSERKGED